MRERKRRKSGEQERQRRDGHNSKRYKAVLQRRSQRARGDRQAEELGTQLS